MVLIVIDPDFVPFAAVEFAMWIDDKLTSGARAQGEIKCQLMAAGKGDHERRIVGTDRRLEE